MAIGVSFVPSAQGSQGTGTTSPVSPLQQAIQFLSLRLPKVFGPGAISSPQTLTAPGSAGLSGEASPDAFFRQLMQQAGQGGVPPVGVPPGSPGAPGAPSITPGAGVGAPPPAPTPPNASSPYQQAAGMLSPVLARQPGSADALIQAIMQAAPPGQSPQKPTFTPTATAPATPEPDPMSLFRSKTKIIPGWTPPPPTPLTTAPQPIPSVPEPTVAGRFPFGGMTRFGGGTRFGG